MAGGPAHLVDVAELLERADPRPEIEKRAMERGVADLLSKVRAARGIGNP